MIKPSGNTPIVVASHEANSNCMYDDRVAFAIGRFRITMHVAELTGKLWACTVLTIHLTQM